MRRALPLAVLLALALAGSAAAAPLKPPFVDGSVVGKKAIRVSASISPPVQTFGSDVTATVFVLADTKWVDPSGLRLATDFSPFERVGRVIEHQSRRGRFLEREWTWTLRCVSVACVPIVPPSDLSHIFRLRPVSVHFLSPNGKVAYRAGTRFPGIKIISDISPGIVAWLNARKGIKWQYDLAPAVVAYRVSPALVFWLALVLAGLCGATGLALVARWMLRFRKPLPVTAAGPPASSLERALAVFFWAGGRGDETLQRKALERVAAELPFDVAGLSDATREIAWSPETPEDEEVEAISEKAGVLAHPRKGTSE